MTQTQGGGPAAGAAGASVAVTAPVVDPVRRAWIRRRTRRDVTIATISTAAFFALAGWLLVSSPGWPAVQETFFNAEAARRSFPVVLSAFWLNVRIFLVAEPVILVVALLIAVLRGLTAPLLAPLRVVAVLYTDLVRGVPTILLIFLFGFGIPALQLTGVPISPLLWGTVALIVSYSAYVAEVFRAGLQSIHPSQRAAGRSLGLSGGQTMRFVVLPQAVRRVVPPLLNDFVSLQKDTALVGVLGPVEALRAAQIDSSLSFNYTAYVVAALLFIALTVPMARFTDWVTGRMERRQRASGGAW